jgi:hypothetical protein
MHVAFGVKVADLGDIVNIVDADSGQYGASVPVIAINEYPAIGEIWYLCQFPPGRFGDQATLDLADSMWFRSQQVMVVA